MPTYGYECLSCDNQFEINQSIKADALTTCDQCGGTLRKRIYPVGIAFKGSGFYVNDYAPKASGSLKTEASKTDTATTETQSTATSDVKPEAAKADTAAPKTETVPAPKADAKPAAPAAS